MTRLVAAAVLALLAFAPAAAAQEGATHGQPTSGDGDDDVGLEPVVVDRRRQLPGRLPEQIPGEGLALVPTHGHHAYTTRGWQAAP